jgi:hypothetical protein
LQKIDWPQVFHSITGVNVILIVFSKFSPFGTICLEPIVITTFCAKSFAFCLKIEKSFADFLKL